MQTFAFDCINHILYNNFLLLISRHVRTDSWLMKHTRVQIWAPCKQIWLCYDLPPHSLWAFFVHEGYLFTFSTYLNQSRPVKVINLLAILLMPALPHYSHGHFPPNSVCILSLIPQHLSIPLIPFTCLKFSV